MSTKAKYKVGQKVRLLKNVPMNVRTLHPAAWNKFMPELMGQVMTIKQVNEYNITPKVFNYYVEENGWHWHELCFEPIIERIESSWNTHLANRGWITPGKKGGFMTNPVDEVVEAEPVLKKYRVNCSETHYFSYIVEAEDEEQAEEIVREGNVDINIDSDDYDNYSLNGVEEVD